MAVISWPSYYSTEWMSPVSSLLVGPRNTALKKPNIPRWWSPTTDVRSNWTNLRPHPISRASFSIIKMPNSTLLCRLYLESWNSERDLKPHQSSFGGPTSDCNLDWGPSKWAPMNLSGWLKFKKKKKLMLPNAGEDVEKMDHSYVAGGSINGVTLWKSLIVFNKG